MMERSNFFNDQTVLSDDLNNIAVTVQDQLTLRSQAPLGNSGGIGAGNSAWSGSVTQGGVYGYAKDYLNTAVNFYINQNSPSQITLAVGTALDALGNVIYLASPKTMVLTGSDNNYEWVSSPSVVNYIKLRYQETSGSLKSDSLGNQYATRYYGSYYVEIDSATPLTNDILLGTFPADGSGNINTSTIQDRRTYVRTLTSADAVALDPTDLPVPTWSTVNDHVQALGTGTPTNKNAHGLTPTDIGWVDTTPEHREEGHVPGIVDLTGAYSTYRLVSYTPQINLSAINTLSFQPPVDANMGIVISGSVYSGSLPSISATTLFGLSGANTYYVYAQADGTVNATASSAFVPGPDGQGDNTKLFLCSVYCADGATLNTLVPFYPIFTSAPFGIRPDFSEGTSNPATSLAKTATLQDTLNRMRYQLGMAIDSTPGDWNKASPPLTAGASSNADPYHRHSPQNLIGAASTVTAVALNTLTSGSVTPADALHTHTPSNLLGVNATVTATNLNTLTAGATTNADSLHTHSFFGTTTVLTPGPAGYLVSDGNYMQNTTGRPVFVTFTCQSNSNSGDDTAMNFNLYINTANLDASGGRLSLFVLDLPGISGNPSYLAGTVYTLSGIVPNGYWFRIGTSLPSTVSYTGLMLS
jgi:hypothetical protein